MSKSKLLCLLAACLLSSSCGSGGSEDAAAAQSTNIEGVWVGTRTATVYICIIGVCAPDHYDTAPVMALAARDGRIHLFTAGFRQIYVGRANVSGGHVSGTLRHICDPLDGPPILGHVRIDGSFSFRRTLDLSYDLDECIGDGVFNLRFDPEFLQPASLPTIEGEWSSPQAFLNVAADGEILGATDTGCQLSGNVTPGSDTARIFDVSLNVENCGSLDGQFTGLATVMDDDAGPSMLVMSTMRYEGIFAMGLSR